MSYNISKELFEKVMNVKLTTDLSIAPYYNEVNGCEEEDLILINYNFIWIPLDTFFFKCKEWAFWNDYEIIVRMRIIDIYRDEHKIDYGYEINHTNNGIIKTSWWIGLEQQAAFDACQWILDNKDKQ